MTSSRLIPNTLAAFQASLSNSTASLDGNKSKISPRAIPSILALPAILDAREVVLPGLNDFPDTPPDITLDFIPGFTLGPIPGFTLDLIPGFVPDIPPGLGAGAGAGAGAAGGTGAEVLLNKLDAFEVYSLTFSLNGTLLKYSLALVPKFLNIEGFGALVVALGELAALSLAALAASAALYDP